MLERDAVIAPDAPRDASWDRDQRGDDPPQLVRTVAQLAVGVRSVIRPVLPEERVLLSVARRRAKPDDLTQGVHGTSGG